MTTTNERDELADEITTFRERWYGSIGGGSAKEDIDLANHLKAAGYRKPRVIETAAELDALPVGSVVLNQYPSVWHKGGRNWYLAGSDGGQKTVPYLPATVLYEPAA